MGHGRTQSGSRERGSAVIEASLIAPWIFVLFVAVLDFGFYSYALIATENAARAAALYACADKETATAEAGSNHDTNAGGCRYVLGELQSLPNVGTGLSACNKLPVTMAVTKTTGPNSSPLVNVAITYQTIPLFPLPFLPGRMTIVRSVQMRVRND